MPARIADNVKFAYTAKIRQKAKFVYKELGAMPSPGRKEMRI